VIVMTNDDRRALRGAHGSDGGTTLPSLPRPTTLPPDVEIRRYRGPGDLPGMSAAANEWRIAMGFLELVTLASMEVQYANMETSDPLTDCFIAERDGTTTGYARVEWADTRDGERTYGTILIVAPGPERPAVVDGLLDVAEARSTAISATHDTDRPRILDLFASGADADVIAAAGRRGYVLVRRGFEMLRPDLDAIPDVPLPPGLEVRPALPEHLRAIWEADAEAFRDHWGWVDDSESGWERFRADPLADPTLWRIAWDGDEIAGQVRSYIDAETNERLGRLTGWTEYISVRRPWRRRGLARALLADSLRAIRDRGMEEAALSVDAGNETGALHLYESLGFTVQRTELIHHRPMPAPAGVASREPGR
jgi:mycothiol synthase